MDKLEKVAGLLAMLRAAMREIEVLPLSKMDVLMDAMIADPAGEDWHDVLLFQVLWFEVKSRRDLGDTPARYAAIIERFEKGWVE